MVRNMQLGISIATNISFVACQFLGNVVSEMISTKALKLYHKSNFLIVGPTQIRKTISGYYRSLTNQYNVISIYNMAVDIANWSCNYVI